MTEVLFAASVAFVGYVIYALIDEQIKSSKPVSIEVEPESALTTIKPPPSIVSSEPKKKVRSSAPASKPRTPAVSKNIDLPKLVGTTAGIIWNYLNVNGPTSVVKMVQELPEDNKTLQRSIGWLAQEDKITLDTIERVETIALKN